MRHYRFVFFGCLTLCLGALSACHSTKQVKGNQQEITEVRPLPIFHQVTVNGAYQIEILQGTSSSVQITTDKNIEPLITTKTQNGILSISNQANTVFLLKKPIRIQITTHSIDHVVCTTQCALSLSHLNADALRIETQFNGVTGADLSTAADVAHATQQSNAEVLMDLSMEGVVRSLSLDLTGTVRVNAAHLATQSATVSLKGSGFLSLQVSHRLDAKAIGALYLKYLGNPLSLNFFVIGNGKLEGSHAAPSEKTTEQQKSVSSNLEISPNLAR